MIPSQKVFTLDTIKCDYITLTSFDFEFFKALRKHLEENYDKWAEVHKMQYFGKMFSGNLGTAFLGSGKQKGVDHFMLQISGEMADASFALCNSVIPYGAVCKRFDVQMTVKQPSRWDPLALVNRLDEKGKDPQLSGTRKSGLQTVYVGERKEVNRFTRIYQKKSVDGKLLRLEVELKRRRAEEFGKLIANEDKLYDAMCAELLLASQADSEVELLFASKILNKSKPVKVKSIEGNTYAWIVGTCLPAIEKYIFSHDSEQSGEIVATMQRIVERWQR